MSSAPARLPSGHSPTLSTRLGSPFPVRFLHPPANREGSVDKLCRATVVVTLDDAGKGEKIPVACGHEGVAHRLADTDVGVDERIRPGELQEALAILVGRSAEDGAPRPALALPAVAKLQIRAILLGVFVRPPSTCRHLSQGFLDLRAQPAPADVANAQGAVARVLADDDGHRGRLPATDLGHHVGHHLRGRVLVVAVVVSGCQRLFPQNTTAVLRCSLRERCTPPSWGMGCFLRR